MFGVSRILETSYSHTRVYLRLRDLPTAVARTASAELRLGRVADRGALARPAVRRELESRLQCGRARKTRGRTPIHCRRSPKWRAASRRLKPPRNHLTHPPSAGLPAQAGLGGAAGTAARSGIAAFNAKTDLHTTRGFAAQHRHSRHSHRNSHPRRRLAAR
jgi:hypothetical protein